MVILFSKHNCRYLLGHSTDLALFQCLLLSQRDTTIPAYSCRNNILAGSLHALGCSLMAVQKEIQFSDSRIHSFNHTLSHSCLHSLSHPFPTSQFYVYQNWISLSSNTPESTYQGECTRNLIAMLKGQQLTFAPTLLQNGSTLSKEAQSTLLHNAFGNALCPNSEAQKKKKPTKAT